MGEEEELRRVERLNGRRARGREIGLPRLTASSSNADAEKFCRHDDGLFALRSGDRLSEEDVRAIAYALMVVSTMEMREAAAIVRAEGRPEIVEDAHRLLR